MKITGHRGARGLAPENTIAGLRKGLQHHVDELEFDLRVTRDGVVILNHDPYLTDPNGDKHVVAEHTYAELKRHKPDLATFEEVLEAIGAKVHLYIEVKSDEPIEPIVKILHQFVGGAHSGCMYHFTDVSLASFSQAILLELQAALPEIEKIVLEKWSGVRATYRARQLGTKRIVMNQKWLWWGFIRSMARGGYQLGTYTLNDPAKARRWARYGLDTVVTDFPDRFEKP